MNLIGICGREGAGKSSICSYLCGTEKREYVYFECKNPELYIISVLFDWDYEKLTKNDKLENDPIWGLNVEEAKKQVLNLLRTYVDSEYTYPESALIPVEIINTSKNTKWREYSLADPLKKISSVIFQFPEVQQENLFEILLGLTEETRVIRENISSIKYNQISKYQKNKADYFTGRSCLEYLGTDVFRNNFDQKTWIKIFHREATLALHQGYSVVLGDVRFDNEKDAVLEFGGEILVVYRNETDLILTDEDKKGHPAKWTFLTFIPYIKNVKKIQNNGTLDDLYLKVKSLINN